jgi:hypothetical protein
MTARGGPPHQCVGRQHILFILAAACSTGLLSSYLASCLLLPMSLVAFADLRSSHVHGITHPGKGQRGGRRALSSGNLRYTGLRYRCLLPTTDLSCFPDPFRRLIHSCQDDFVSRDRGRTRQRNDESFESRATFFSSWLRCRRLDVPGLLLTL